MKIKSNPKAVRAAILDSGMSNAELIAATGVSGALIWKAMNGKNRIEAKTLYKIAKALGVKPSSLADFDDEV